MIEIDIDVLVNGKPIRIESDLNDLLSEYILKKVGITQRTNILDSIDPADVPKKHYKPARLFGEQELKVPRWTDDEETAFAVSVEELRKTGMNFSKIAEQLSPQFGDRSKGALYQKVMELKKKGVIKII